MLRAQVAAEPGHPRAVELVGELAVRSSEFAALWARHDVEETTRGRMRVNHPLVGQLNLDWDAYPMPGAPGPARQTRPVLDACLATLTHRSARHTAACPVSLPGRR